MSSRNLMTFIARLADQMVLVATMDNTFDLEEYKVHAKKVMKMLNHSSPPRCVLEAGEFTFYYIIENGVVYLTLAERSFPRRLAFDYLAELSSVFFTEYGAQLSHFTRPYAAVAFDTMLDKIRSKYLDPSATNKLSRLNTNLQEIQSVMTQNIQEIILRGEKLERVEDRSARMLADSKLFKQNARYINMLSLWKTYAPIAAIALVVVLVIWLRFG